ncbi:hypothetical protein DFH09DRAFT_1110887 [Mycena vulgaris]|nr:hypothetical protein DFH09DRAFT_1110887 [Mycena vulgaris]
MPNLGSKSLHSSLIALSLTWGTIGSAILLDWNTPTIGIISNRTRVNQLMNAHRTGVQIRELSDLCRELHYHLGYAAHRESVELFLNCLAGRGWKSALHLRQIRDNPQKSCQNTSIHERNLDHIFLHVPVCWRLRYLLVQQQLTLFGFSRLQRDDFYRDEYSKISDAVGGIHGVSEVYSTHIRTEECETDLVVMQCIRRSVCGIQHSRQPAVRVKRHYVGGSPIL